MGGSVRALHLGMADTEDYDQESALQETNAAVASLVALSPGMRVADAGCGRAASARWLADNDGCVVVGLNLEPSQLMGMPPVQKSGAHGRVELVVADFHEMPLRDASCDVVWLLESVSHTYDRSTLWSEVARVLRPDGTLVVAEAFTTHRASWRGLATGGAPVPLNRYSNCHRGARNTPRYLKATSVTIKDCD